MKYHEYNTETQTRISAIFIECGVFFAFSDKQFEENKTPLQEGDKYVRWIGGGFLPKLNSPLLHQRTAELQAWQDQAIKAVEPEDAIRYELGNHESWYTGEIDQAMDVLEPMGYTREQVLAVYRKGDTP